MDNLYVWRNTLGRKQKDVPQAGDTWLSEKHNIYMLLEFCYNGCLILTQNAKDYIVSNFYKPEIYKLNDYHLVYNNSLHKEKLPPLINK